MTKFVLAGVVVMMAGLAGVGNGAEAEMVANPVYTSWKKFTPGTTIQVVQKAAMKKSPNGAQETTSISFKQTLKEVKEDGVVLEVTTKLEDREYPAQEITVPSTVEKGAADLAYLGKPIKNVTASDVKEGKETVVVEGTKKEAMTKRMKIEAKEDVGTVKGDMKIWIIDSVPGGMLKMEVEFKNEAKGTEGTGTMEVTVIQIKT